MFFTFEKGHFFFTFSVSEHGSVRTRISAEENFKRIDRGDRAISTQSQSK